MESLNSTRTRASRDALTVSVTYSIMTNTKNRFYVK